MDGIDSKVKTTNVGIDNRPTIPNVVQHMCQGTRRLITRCRVIAKSSNKHVDSHAGMVAFRVLQKVLFGKKKKHAIHPDIIW